MCSAQVLTILKTLAPSKLIQRSFFPDIEKCKILEFTLLSKRKCTNNNNTKRTGSISNENNVHHQRM